MGTVVEGRFAAMGTTVHVVVVGGPQALLERARHEIERAERRWSRFRPDSELTALNATTASPVLVSTETFQLLQLACQATHDTGGRFDPTVHDALVAAGYDRSFESLAQGATASRPPSGPAPGVAGVVLDPVTGCVTLAPGTRIDLGGVAKGHTADVTARAITDAGAAGCCVNIGGDVRVTGRPPTASGWLVELRCPGALTALTVALADGAVCTSTRLRRTWRCGTTTAHHLIDPGTGRPCRSGVATVSVVSRSAAQAEVLTKAAFVAGWPQAAELLTAHQVTGIVVTDDGCLHRLPGLERFRPRRQVAAP